MLFMVVSPNFCCLRERGVGRESGEERDRERERETETERDRERETDRFDLIHFYLKNTVVS